MLDNDTYSIECLAMAIVNHTNEINNTDIAIRQANNDKCFDYAKDKIIEFLNNKKEQEKDDYEKIMKVYEYLYNQESRDINNAVSTLKAVKDKILKKNINII